MTAQCSFAYTECLAIIKRFLNNVIIVAPKLRPSWWYPDIYIYLFAQLF